MTRQTFHRLTIQTLLTSAILASLGGCELTSPGPTNVSPVIEKQYAAGSHQVTSRFASSTNADGTPRTDGWHRGIDIHAPLGTPVFAAAQGVVEEISVGTDTPCGRRIVMSTQATGERYQMTYCHLSKTLPYTGQFINAGRKIGEVGSSGTSDNYLHFEVRGADDKPVDPEPLLFGETKTNACVDVKQSYLFNWSKRSIEAGGPGFLYPIACTGQ
jgi:murein DD-endopeptidase MepM/ murein hydrolase activator NlpD